MIFSTFDAKSFICYIVEGSNSIRGEFNYIAGSIYISSSQVEIGSPATSWIGGETTCAADHVTVKLGGFRLYTEGIQVGVTGPPGADSTVPGPQGPPGESIVGPQGPPGADSTILGPQGPPGESIVGPQGPPSADSTVPGPPAPPELTAPRRGQ